MIAPPPERLRQPTLNPTPHLPGMPPVTPGDDHRAYVFVIVGVPPGYVYRCTPLAGAQ